MLNQQLVERLDTLESVERLTPFFVGGVVKSGATWVERILDFHPQVACKGEGHFGQLLEPLLRDAIARYNEAIPDRGNWLQHRREGSDRTPVVQYSYVTEDLEFLMNRTVSLMLAKWAREKSIRCVGDKSPDNADFLALLRKLFPAMRFVYVVRDVRDIVVSGWFFNMTLSPDKFRQRFPTIDTYARAVSKKWAAQVGTMMAPAAAQLHAAHRIKYEDLLLDADTEVDRLLEFLGVDRDRSVVRACITSADFQRLSGGRRRGQEHRGSFYRKGVAGDWKNHLDDASLRTIEDHCAPVMQLLGYR